MGFYKLSAFTFVLGSVKLCRIKRFSYKGFKNQEFSRLSIENRAFMRTTSSAVVEMRHASFGSMTVKAMDLSDGGISVDLRQHIVPPIGTLLDVIIRRHSGVINIEPVKMEVRHVQSSGIVGLKFV